MALAAGDLRHVITIQVKAETTDEFGGPVFTWTDFAFGVRCKIVPLTGKESIVAQAEMSQARTRFLMRYLPGVGPDMRIVDDAGQVHEILYVANVKGEGRELEILAKAWVNEG